MNYLLSSQKQDSPEAPTFDLSRVPAFRKSELSEYVVDLALAYLEQPGVRERFEEWKKQRAERATPKGGDTRKE